MPSPPTRRLPIEPERPDADGRRAGAAEARTARCATKAASRRWPARPSGSTRAPLTPEGLRGKVVLVDFWTYSCINCLRTLPYLRAWAEKYKDAGLVVVGVHAPEFAFEKQPANVRRAAKDLGIGFPVAVDSNFAIWRAFGNQYWPAFYFVDAQGRIRHHQFGEGQYAKSEQVIQQLLAEAGRPAVPADAGRAGGPGHAGCAGCGAGPVGRDLPGLRARAELRLAWRHREGSCAGLSRGFITARQPVGAERRLDGGTRSARCWCGPMGASPIRFQARDLHLVLGPAADGKPVRFQVLIDGKPPLADHGTDTDAQGNGTIDGQSLYQLVRQTANDEDRLFEIEFLDAGAQAYVFTFG